MHLAIGGGVEVIDLWLGDRGTREAHKRTRAEGYHRVCVFGSGQTEMRFHAAVVVRGAHGAEF